MHPDQIKDIRCAVALIEKRQKHRKHRQIKNNLPTPKLRKKAQPTLMQDMDTLLDVIKVLLTEQ